MAEAAGLNIKTVVPREHTSRVLREGDQIEFSVTHEVETVRGDKFWCKYGVISAVQSGEITKEAVTRVADHVNDEILKRITEAAHRAMSGGQ